MIYAQHKFFINLGLQLISETDIYGCYPVLIFCLLLFRLSPSSSDSSIVSSQQNASRPSLQPPFHSQQQPPYSMNLAGMVSTNIPPQFSSRQLPPLSPNSLEV